MTSRSATTSATTSTTTVAALSKQSQPSSLMRPMMGKVARNLYLQRFQQVRRSTLDLVAGLSEEDCCVQAMPDASPAKWHLAHTTWFFETFILAKYEANFQPFAEDFVVLFNSYYNGVGAKHPRAQRGLLTRPGLATVLAYRANVETRIADLFTREELWLSHQLDELIELGLQHEQQHQELLQTDLLYLFSCNPLQPALRPQLKAAVAATPSKSSMQWLEFEAQLCEIGYAFGQFGQIGTGARVDFCFDNELPRHRQFIEAYQLSKNLINNSQYLAFIEAGAYSQAEHWLAEGWDWVQREGVSHPLYWRRGQQGLWQEFSQYGLQALELTQPVLHLSYFEADAYARWAGARLPTEAEWEAAACSELADECADLFGCAWQWTSSSYAAYPGFACAPGAVGEYNGKFMVNQYVLRGSSAFTPVGHSRYSYRNFFPSHAQWQRTGLRLARSV